ncbi:MAG: GNAT family N-acetyltransferase [Candidatus Desulfacyla sp.]
MSYSLQIINPVESPIWDDMVLASECYSVFHSSAWMRVLHEAYRYRPYVFLVFDGRHPMVMLPVMEVGSFLTGRRGVSLPFSDYCDPVLSSNGANPEAVNAILTYAAKAKWKSLEFRGGSSLFPETEASSSYSGHVLLLNGDTDALFKAFRDSTRRNIKKAEKSGIHVEVDDSMEFLEKFYGLHCITRKHHGLPPQPFDFFRKLHFHVIAQNQGRIFLAFHDGKAVAGDICLHFGSRATYKYGASDRRLQHLRPSNLLMWEIIRYYALRGFESLDLGRTTTDNTGLMQFKNGWGCKQYPISYYRYDVAKRSFLHSKATGIGRMNTVLKHAPIPLLRGLGSMLYRHMA